MLEFETIVKTAYLIIIAFILLLIVARFIYFLKTKHSRHSINKEVIAHRIGRYALYIAIPLFIFGLITFVFVLQKGNLFASIWMKTIFIFSLSLFGLSEIWYNTMVLPKGLNRVLSWFFLFLTTICGLYLSNLYLTALAHPSVENSVVIELPFSGRWIATGAGATQLTNHHDRIESQKYAIDISKIGENGKLFVGSGKEKEESNTYGIGIFSPVDGQVAFVIDTLPDIPTKERKNLAGNHIVIQFQDSLFVALAHLRQNSITLKKGDRVKKGEILGEVGLSGNTDFCHLHIHIQDRPIYDIIHGKSYPIRFKKLKRKRFLFWNNVNNGYLLSNDIVENN